ncbi:MAG: NifU family protein [Parvibaculales bacterium]
MFIQTEETPNPATLKFMPGKDVMGDAHPADFPSVEAAANAPLAQALFKVQHVESVFLGRDFITVTKGDAEWQHVKPHVLTAIMDFFVSGLPVINADAALPDAGDGQESQGEDGEIVDTIKELLDTRVRPAVAQDGGDIVFNKYQDGVVFLELRGACAGCPSSTATLKQGVENLLKHFVPVVTEVRAVE